MIRKHTWKLTAVLVLAMACSGLMSAPRPAQAEPKRGIKIGLVTGIGGVDDRSFNQSAREGGEVAAEQLSGTLDYIETTDPGDQLNNLSLYGQREYDVVITTGQQIAPAVIEAAKRFPKVHFIAVDLDVEAVFTQQKIAALPNVTGLIFPGRQVGFLTGVLAARMSKAGIVGVVLGSDQIQPVVEFKEGLEAGALYANPKIKVLSAYNPKPISEAFTDPQWGSLTAGELIDRGADVVFSGGGTTGNGGLVEVAKRTSPSRPLYCIGVDTDQWETVVESRPCLISSGLKKIRKGVYDLLLQFAEGTLKPGNFTGDIGLAPFHDFEKLVPNTVKQELLKVETDLKSGKLSAGGVKATPTPGK